MQEKATGTISFLDYFSEPKEFLETHTISFPVQGDSCKLEGRGKKTNTPYIVDINRKRCTMTRITFQNRLKSRTITLIRLDIDTKGHRNPNKEWIGGTHIHIYQDDVGDKQAFELDDVERIRKIIPNYRPIKVIEGDFIETFKNFAAFCGFQNMPGIQSALEFPG